jgi:hypothetical protein
MRDDHNRVTVALWNMIKPYMMMETNGEYTPTFGEVVDRFRTMWNVYISATPATNEDIIIDRYRYEVFQLEGNNIKNRFTGSDHSYYLAMRKAIEKALEFVKE